MSSRSTVHLSSARWAWLPAMTLAAGLAACGGGDEPPAAPTTLGGTAAIGAPVANGTVSVQCAGGAPLQATTSSAGAWQVTLQGQTLPCALKVSGGNLAAGQAYHSVAVSWGTANITPLTDLLVAQLTGQAPATWFAGANAAANPALTAEKLQAALGKLRTALGLAALNNVDPVTTSFTPTQGNPVDDALEALQAALRSQGLDYAALVAAAQGSAFTLEPAFRAALAQAYGSLQGGTGTGGTTGGSGGNATLKLDIQISGIASPSVTITNVPKPGTQAKFCADLTDPNSGTSLSKAIPDAVGTFSIDSCSFSGNVGKVSATLAMTAPIAMKVPYTVIYTYQ